MSALLSIEYPHWLIIAGVALLFLGCVGLALRQREAGAEPLANEGDKETYASEDKLNELELYNRAAKEKRRERWVEKPADDDRVEVETQVQGTR